MKNYWLDRKKTIKFKGKFQEADPINRGGRKYALNKKFLEEAIAWGQYLHEKYLAGDPMVVKLFDSCPVGGVLLEGQRLTNEKSLD